ncbi:hypothetical protein PAECIP111802_06734 [Paenibacillus allorhizosphaerae]|uniref:Uncharacterized protein n=1 Tax=Paenibacillus allorhizosphaerae TaxID=2849866 RepID=A0ABM8VT93_9BACL|nr:hypothetical protein PAECIP111802_06734 [Paenibacillus allorhizosphaerae]
MAQNTAILLSARRSFLIRKCETFPSLHGERTFFSCSFRPEVQSNASDGYYEDFDGLMLTFKGRGSFGMSRSR